MEAVSFEHAIASRDDGVITIALFGSTPSASLACVQIVKCSADAARGLLEELGSVLNTGEK